MKSTKQSITAILLIIFMCVSIKAQSDRYQIYAVHEDHVIDGMQGKHDQADKVLLNAAKEHKIKGMSWITFQADDNRVMYLSPIQNMAELDNNPFEDLEKKIGKDEFEKLFEGYHDTYSQHGDYILRLDKELSYMPDGITQTPEGQTYRELTYYHIPPGKGEKADQLARSVKELYSKKGSKVHYRVYKSGFGNMGNYLMVAVAAESPEALEQMREENMKLLGEEGRKIFDEIDNTVAKKEKITGHLKPELSYVSNN